MAVVLEAPSPNPGHRKQWTRAELDWLENVGILPGHYELLDGEIISKMGQNGPHAITVMRLIAYFLRLFPAGDLIRTQATMEVRQTDGLLNRPEPDLVLLRIDRHTTVPAGTDALLVVEVSDTTQHDDFGGKVGLYARAGVAEYWVVDLLRRVIIAFRQPHDGEWRERLEFTENEQIACLAAPNQAVLVTSLLSPL